jgi:hypothetical protein
MWAGTMFFFLVALALTTTIQSSPLSSGVKNVNGNILQACQVEDPILMWVGFYLLVESLQDGYVVAGDIANAMATALKGDSSLPFVCKCPRQNCKSLPRDGTPTITAL